MPGRQPDTRVPHDDLDLVDLARRHRLLRVEAIAITQPHHAVAQPLRETTWMYVDQLRRDVGVARVRGDVSEETDRSDDLDVALQRLGRVDEDVAACLHPAVVIR